MKLKYISGVPVVIIMAMIFFFSSKPAVISQESSLSITRAVVNVYEKITNVAIETADRMQLLSSLDHVVRKTAHFLEYAALAASLVLNFTIWKVDLRRNLGLSVLITTAYAITDEFHQTFIPGRSGQVSDVLLDSCGGITGALLFILLITIFMKKKRSL